MLVATLPPMPLWLCSKQLTVSLSSPSRRTSHKNLNSISTFGAVADSAPKVDQVSDHQDVRLRVGPTVEAVRFGVHQASLAGIMYLWLKVRERKGAQAWEGACRSYLRRLSYPDAGAAGGLQAASWQVGVVRHGISRDGGTHPRDVCVDRALSFRDVKETGNREEGNHGGVREARR